MSNALRKVRRSKYEFALHKNAGPLFSPLIRTAHNLNILLSPLPFHKFPPQLRHLSHEMTLYITYWQKVRVLIYHPSRNRYFLIVIGIYYCGNQYFAEARETDENRPGINSPWQDYNHFLAFYLRKYTTFKLLFWSTSFKVYIYYCHYRMSKAGYFLENFEM